jgi:hypothetical protein
MIIPFPILRIELDGGKTAAVPTPRGAGVRVVEGRVWATTSGELADVWLAAGDEHRVAKRGLTVLEAAGARATVEVTPPAEHTRSMQRAICGFAAAVLTAFTIAVAVILPAQVDAGHPVSQHLASAKVPR